MNPRIIAIDWSGAVDGSQSKIWLAEAEGGQLVRLECGRTREAVTEHLISESRQTQDIVVGLDFAFGLPQWFLQKEGLATGTELWELVAREGERWLSECSPPFWGRPGRGKPVLPEYLRKTDRDAPTTGGIRPKSVFQVGGAGAVGTGSLRGMPVLKRLREAGFSIWPFDDARGSVVVEIYPRLLTGPVNKGDAIERVAYLEQRYPALEPSMRKVAASSEDAFDAAVSALVMAEHKEELRTLAVPQDPQLRQEGVIWAPVRASVATRSGSGAITVPAAPKRRQYDSSLTRVEPVFDALVALGRPDWVGELLDVVSASGVTTPSSPGRLDLNVTAGYWGKTETALQPPVALLSWLVRNLGRSGIPRPGERDFVEKKRRALWDGDAKVVDEALRLLRTSSRDKKWHVLEGQTCPDAYIVTPDALIVVEGKRTEAGPTIDTTWMCGRHQMLRHLDAAWEIRGKRDVFGFFVVEADPDQPPTQVPDVWKEAANATVSPEVIARSLPHRGSEEREGIAAAFIGVTTWQAIVARFGLDAARALPRDVTMLQAT